MSYVNVERYQERAQALYGAYRKTVEDAKANTAWSREGVADVTRQAVATYRAGMQKLMDEARFEVAAEQKRNQSARQAAIKAQAEALRTQLGDSVYADLARRRLEQLDGLAIVGAIEAAPTEYDAALLRSYGALVIDGRIAAGAPAAQDRIAQKRLQELAGAVEAPFVATAQELAGAEHGWIARLDALKADENRAAFGEMVRAGF